MVKNLPANAEDMGLIPVSERFPREGNGNPVQYSCGEIPRTERPGAGTGGIYNLVTKTFFSKSNLLKQFNKSLLMIGKNPVLLANKSVAFFSFLKNYL